MFMLPCSQIEDVENNQEKEARDSYLYAAQYFNSDTLYTPGMLSTDGAGAGAGVTSVSVG